MGSGRPGIHLVDFEVNLNEWEATSHGQGQPSSSTWLTLKLKPVTNCNQSNHTHASGFFNWLEKFQMLGRVGVEWPKNVPLCGTSTLGKVS